MENGEDWGSCKGCQHREPGGQEVVLHRDSWDRVKRVNQPKAIEHELDNAKHRGDWVSIKYEFDICKFDGNPVIQDDVKHRCPWHSQKQQAQFNSKEWWE